MPNFGYIFLVQIHCVNMRIANNANEILMTINTFMLRLKTNNGRLTNLKYYSYVYYMASRYVYNNIVFDNILVLLLRPPVICFLCNDPLW